MSAQNIRRFRRRFQSEELEPRLVLSANHGVLVAMDARLTISFAPDGTQIADESSSLFAHMSGLGSEQDWQSAVVRGFQTWITETNGDIGRVADDGSPFGVEGRPNQDPRFGDIRIGAIPLDHELYAVSISAAESVDGTWTGDVIFNTNVALQTIDDLFAVALHEAGHVLGLEHSSDPESPMYGQGIPDVVIPTSEDIVDLQAIYGARSEDVADGHQGNQIQTTLHPFQYEDQPRGTAPTIVFGDITFAEDVDSYFLNPPAGYSGSITLEIVTDGISHLAPRVAVTDAAGALVTLQEFEAGESGTIPLYASNLLTPMEINVSSSAANAFGIGGYSLIVWFDDINVASTSAVNELARTPLRQIPSSELEEFFSEGELLFANDDNGSDDLPNQEIQLESAPGFVEGTRYIQQASIEHEADVDRYLATSPDPSQVDLHWDWARISVRSLEGDLLRPVVSVTDDAHVPVSIEYVVSNDSSMVVQFGPVGPETDYSFVIESDVIPSTGNYELDVAFGVPRIVRETFADGQLASDETDRYVLRQDRPQIYHFVLSAQGDSNDSVRLRILDASGKLVREIHANGGQTSTLAVFLSGPEYRFVFHSNSGSELIYALDGNTVDDPLGPIAVDTAESPFEFDEERLAIHIAAIFSF